MKNNECIVYITITKSGWTQKYRKGKNGWIQINPTGTVHPLSAEQLLSHILPALKNKNLKVIVKKLKRKK